MAEVVPGKRRRAPEGGRSGKRAKVEDRTTVHEVGNGSEQLAPSVATCVSLQVREDRIVSGCLERERDCARSDVGAEEGEGVRCGFEFYNQACEDLARSMLGCVLVCVGEGGEECRGRVVETEAYLGREDKAAHSYNGRQSKANEAMFMVRRRRRFHRYITACPLPAASWHRLCVLHIWRALLLQCVELWGRCSCPSASSGAGRWAGGDEAEEGRVEEGS